MLFLCFFFLPLLFTFFVLHSLCAFSCQPLCFPCSLSPSLSLSYMSSVCLSVFVQTYGLSLLKPRSNTHSAAVFSDCCAMQRWLRNTNPPRMSTGRTRGAANGAGGDEEKDTLLQPHHCISEWQSPPGHRDKD